MKNKIFLPLLTFIGVGLYLALFGSNNKIIILGYRDIEIASIFNGIFFMIYLYSFDFNATKKIPQLGWSVIYLAFIACLIACFNIFRISHINSVLSAIGVSLVSLVLTSFIIFLLLVLTVRKIKRKKLGY